MKHKPWAETTAPAALTRWLAGDGSRPIITYRGPADVRIELSATTAANAVAKAVNYLTDDLLAEPGDSVLLDIPLHWQVPVLAMGCWAAGLAIALPGADCEPIATLGTGDGTGRGEPLAVSLHPWGMPLGGATPRGWTDLAAEVRAQPDRASLRWPAREDVWLRSAKRTWTGDELAGVARRLLDDTGASVGSRLLTSAGPDRPCGLVSLTLAPAIAGGSIVLADQVPVTQITQSEGNPVPLRGIEHCG